jgi:S-formylglutathione hydrolase FrmB
MIRHWRTTAAAVLAALAVATSASASTGAQVVAQRPIGPDAVELTIATPAFTAPTKVQVFLPAGYDSDPSRRWPVTYYLHGMQGDQTRFAAWYGKLIKGFPSIFVAPDGGQGGFYSDWYNGGAGGPPMYETFDIDQLVPLIDEHFRTIAKRAGHALIGESMGGFGVLTYAARHPDLFAAAVSMSGFIDTNTAPGIGVITAAPLLQQSAPNSIWGPRATDEVRWRGHNPTDLAGNLRDVDLQVRTAEGVPGTVVEGTDPTSAVGCTEEAGVYQTNVDFHQRMLALGVPHLYKDYGAGCHDLMNFQREFTDSLPGLEQAFAHPRPAPRSFDYESIEPHFAIWGWRVDADPARAPEFLQMRSASRHGVTLVGSGRTTITTPPWFHGRRMRLTVDLGPPHPNQQYTAAARLAGEDGPGYFVTRTVRFR